MKVTLDFKPTTIALEDIPVGACVRIRNGSLPSSILYLRTRADGAYKDALVRLNDGEMFGLYDLDGVECEVVDAEVVIHG